MDKKNYGTIILGAAVLFLIIGGIGTYFIVNNNDNDKKPNIDNQQSNTSNIGTEKKSLSIDENGLVPDGYTILLNTDGDLYLIFKNAELTQKYGKEFKIATNVSNFYNIEIGQGGGCELYYIYNDKTVGSASVEYNIHLNEDIEITNKLEYQNIVEIKQGFSNDISPAAYPIFVDESGKEYHQ